MHVISLTTDFGLQDNFVGVMKGVILGINPACRIVDLVHDLTPHQVAQGAWALYTAYRYFPAGTIHTVVIDPGVGGDRAALAVETDGHFFVAPDNGVLTYVLESAPPAAVHRITRPGVLRPPIGRTFHGRDVFAPAAAHLSLGKPLAEMGPAHAPEVFLDPLAPQRLASGYLGRIVYTDRFGNLITNIAADLLPSSPEKRWRFSVGSLGFRRLSPSYDAVEPGQYLLIVGSAGFLEIARNQSRAEQPPALTRGARVLLEFYDRDDSSESRAPGGNDFDAPPEAFNE